MTHPDQPGPPSRDLVAKLEARLDGTPGVAAVEVDRPPWHITMKVERKRAARFGMTANAVLEQARALAQAGDIDALRRLEIDTPDGARVPFTELAELKQVPPPNDTHADEVRLRVYRDDQTSTRKARAAVKATVANFELPAGVVIEWHE